MTRRRATTSSLNSSGTRASSGGAAAPRRAPATGSGACASGRALASTRRRRRVPAVLGGRDALRVRPLAVVQDRVRPVEAVAREALLVAQLARRRRAARRVLLARDARRRRHPIEHQDARRAPALLRCSRSMLSNSARKLPAPKPSIALALDDLEEERPGLRIVVEAGRLLQEDLQQVLPLRARRRRGSRARAGSSMFSSMLPMPIVVEPLGQHVVVACPASA